MLGGTSRTAELLLVRPNAVSMMISRDTIPPAYHLRLYLLLVDLGYQIDTECVFGYSLDLMREASKAARRNLRDQVHAA